MVKRVQKEESEFVVMPSRVRPIEEALLGHKRYIELHQQGWNNGEIADVMDVSRERVRQVLSFYGLKSVKSASRTVADKQLVDAICRLYDYKDLREIARSMRVAASALEEAVRQRDPLALTLQAEQRAEKHKAALEQRLQEKLDYWKSVSPVGLLTVTSMWRDESGEFRAGARCECGRETSVCLAFLRKGRVFSCGRSGCHGQVRASAGAFKAKAHQAAKNEPKRRAGRV
ncbi:hypothetical protein H6G07_10940 [Phormidium tenue FACHB-1052]|uniref:Uncharacterized protein n=1 Tax=Phormidium tenue NIES-30 TaxID=549789 RepID=A0A1U7J676_9CYAN|nr:hypothetical protein [Phormidium tenue FACHB-1052]OKH48323.1 hypothetical protein NIES30_09815 [Phormidium tenue NIES-30]